ncbi:hypothetical protein F5Y05DRAFT_248908 [Hypoxylon sp. FL0543]|nr:hypothetical protein F5Y05DRAFT_248908 [Hypoxylon sp. FL0543]
MASEVEPESFQNLEYFPAFHDCPYEGTLDSRYIERTSSTTGRNSKHWCLLGEIIQADTIIRPRLVVKDAQDIEFVVAFYPDDPNDMPRILKDFKVGNTIAVFYPFKHYFLDGTTGLRIEKSDEVLIIPLNLEDVMKMNEEVIRYIPVGNVQRKCHGCDKVKDDLNMCGGCRLFCYCDKDCQSKAWNEKGHKKLCKALKRKNVRDLLFLDYETYERPVSFT